MTPPTLSRLSAVDASFLVQERTGSHMQIGGIMVFEGPAPDIEDFKHHIESRMHFVPRYRQRLVYPPMQAGRPFWTDDPDFNIAYHVRDAALPAPGNDEQLERLCARIYSQRLDRRKPLWEMWIVDGLSGGRFALIMKNHHALIDGVAGVDVATILLSPDPDEGLQEIPPWRPAPMPTQGELLELGLRDAVAAPFKLGKNLVGLARGDQAVREDFAEFTGGLTKAVSETLDAAPRTPLNQPISQHRRFRLVRNSLDEFREIKGLLDTTVNDVVLTVTSDALGRWLRSRYYPTDGLKLRALVPVSTRPKKKRGDDAHAGNELLAMRGYLPVEEMDVLKRLDYIKNSMEGLKQSNQAVAADALTAMQNFAPPTVLAQASRLNFSTRLFNLLVTNVPGPQLPLYLLGRQMLDVFPVPFLAENHTLAIGVMSYNGGINFGILADYDAVTDVQVIADGISDARDDLLEATSQVKSKVREVMRSGADVSALAATAEGAAQTAERARAKRASTATPKKPAAKPTPKVEVNGSAKQSDTIETAATAAPTNGAAARKRKTTKSKNGASPKLS